MKVSVISATWNRGSLLDRALATYSLQTLPVSEWEYLVVDDASTDDTLEVIEKWRQRGVPVRVLDAARDLDRPKAPGVWRDGCVLRNAASVHACAEILVSTHPEILVPPRALELAYQTLQDHPGTWVTAIPYWLPPVDPSPAFVPDDLTRLHTLPGFYASDWNGGPHNPRPSIDFSAQNQAQRTDWESEIWWALSLAQWRYIRGFREFKQWGSVDMDFLARRRSLGIPTVVIKDLSSPAASGNLMVYHQYHDEGKRNVPLALAGVQGTSYPTQRSAIDAGGL